MQIARHILPALFLAILVQSCSDDKQPDFYNGTGLLHVELSVAPPTDVELDIPSPSDFAVTLTPDDSPEDAHTWAFFAEFPQHTRYLATDYTITAMSGDIEDEGFDMPCFVASEKFHITEGTVTDISLNATLANTPVTVTATSAYIQQRGGDWGAMIHSHGGNYITIKANETRTAYIKSGQMDFALQLADEVTLSLMTNITASAGVPNRFELDADGDDIVLNLNNREIKRLTVTDAMLNAPSPWVELMCDSEIDLFERTEPEQPAVFTITTPTSLESVVLTLNSPMLMSEGVTAEIDLLHPTEHETRYLESSGVTIPSFTAGPTRFDISGILQQLQYSVKSGNVSQFSLCVTDALGRMSNPATLIVNTIPVDLNIISVSPSVIGINTVDITVATPASSISNELYTVVKNHDGTVSPVDIIAVTPLGNSTYRVTFSLPEGSEPVVLMVYYGSDLKLTLVVDRVSPEYRIETDAFATRVKLRVVAETAELRAVITRNLNVTVNNRPATIYSRDEDSGIITVIGLEPGRRYNLNATLQPDNDKAGRDIAFDTERAEELPNGGFEDIKRGVDRCELPSGGRYSQTFAEIFNCQNIKEFDCWIPAGWANTNLKTFNTQSRNPNTWYMQISVRSIEETAVGDYAVELTSTAFDPDGPEIEPYLQTSTPFTRYSRNIPDIAWRAAGKIFLGTYSYNPFGGPSEIYDEGVVFASRPQSLNGFYSYIPCPDGPDDLGVVTVEVMGNVDGSETAIARGDAELHPSNGYSTFSIPLSYQRFGVKATKIKVMASSSRSIGSIHSESINVPVTFNVIESAATGSRLRLDNLTFAY